MRGEIFFELLPRGPRCSSFVTELVINSANVTESVNPLRPFISYPPPPTRLDTNESHETTKASK